MDFTLDNTNHPFTIGDDRYEIWPEMPLAMMSQMKKLRNMRDLAEQEDGLETILSFFDEILTPESGVLFRTRVADRKIGLRHMMTILPWAMEQWGARPTVASSDSSERSPDDASTPSTVGVSLTGSTA
jgi:hypothetical protein